MKVSNTSERLKEIMELRNLRQVDILQKAKPYCEKHSVKLNKSDLSQYVSGFVEPGQDKLSILSLALNVSETWLMGYDVPMHIDLPIDELEGKTANNGSNVNRWNNKVVNNIKEMLNDEHGSFDFTAIIEKILLDPPVRIDVYGSIPAGIPLEAIQDIQGWEEIPREWTKGDKEYIALKVKGDSMYPKYLDGDTVIIQLQPDCESGQDCACYVNGYEATLKKVAKNEDTITLTPYNPNYPPKTYKHPGEVKILGVVKELRRKV